MSDSNTKTGQGIRLSKEERKDLLAQLERRSSRAEPPERILQRGEQALKDGNVDQGRRILQQLELSLPDLPGLDVFRRSYEEVVSREKRQANLKTTEEMLIRYIQQRKKPLAELAFETLIDLAPSHPRRADYEMWVADLDREVELQQRLDEQLRAGRAALHLGDLAQAKQHLETLRKVDPDNESAAELADEIAQSERGRAQSAGIERAKHEVEELLAGGHLDEAAQRMETLGRMDLPKVTLDFRRKRLDEGRRRQSADAAAAKLTGAFERCLAARDWQGARDAAQRFGQIFPRSSRSAELFNKVTHLEAAERRQQSIAQGLATVERFITQGKRLDAELALKLLQRLDLDKAQLARLEAQIREL